MKTTFSRVLAVILCLVMVTAMLPAAVFAADAADATAVVGVKPTELEVELGASATIEGNGDDVVYASSDESIVTVSDAGEVTALAQGTAYITATASTGAVAVTRVTVIPPAPVAVDSIELSLNVYYNDADTSYYMNETSSETIVVTEAGQYSLTFDCATDLSAEAIAAGVTGLNNLTAVYIKDHAVITGAEPKSYIDNCLIMWDSVVVDDVPMTVTMTEPKNAIKASGQFDTNDPLNSWDGSYVEEVIVNSNVLNITCVENPQKITVTFTLSDLVFGSKTVDAVKPVTTGSITTVGETALEIAEVGQTAEITVKADNPRAAIAFYTSDASVATVPVNGTVNTDGTVTAAITAVGAGECVITAITPDGKTVDIKVSSAVSATEEVEEEVKTAPIGTAGLLTIIASIVMVAALAAAIVIVILLIKESKNEKKDK